MNYETNTSLILWYRENFERYEFFRQLLHATIGNIFSSSKIVTFSITSRTKTLESFSEKIDRKGYEFEDQITDLVGIRVITYLDKDVRDSVELLQNNFNFDPEKSQDKTEELGENRFGYRSFHLTCELGNDRCSLTEFAPFKGMIFEIQIRSILQHAWAEFYHNRCYKSGRVLPPDLERECSALASHLEIGDNLFNQLDEKIDKARLQLNDSWPYPAPDPQIKKCNVVLSKKK